MITYRKWLPAGIPRYTVDGPGRVSHRSESRWLMTEIHGPWDGLEFVLEEFTDGIGNLKCTTNYLRTA